MNKKQKNILIVSSALLLLGGLGYFYFFGKNDKKSKGKSFLEYGENEKSDFFKEQKKTRMSIRNNPNLTPSQKIKEEEALNKENLERFTEEERQAMADYNINKLMNGDFEGQIQFFNPSQFSMF
tara:strand:- start:856 stop:1227 length:372 start_codon:yes stop_codon:yes gene_type:complete